MANESKTDCSAFCFKIIIRAVCADGTPSPAPLENIVVTSKLAQFASACHFPSTLNPGESAECIIPNVTICTNFTDVVTVIGRSATDHTTVTTTPTSILTDSVDVTIKPILIHCESTFTSSIDADETLDNCVRLPDGTTSAPITLTTIVSNDSDVALDVTVKNLPPLVDCTDQVTPIVVQTITIAAHGTATITGCYIATCPIDTTFPIEVQGTVNTNGLNANCLCYFNSNGKPITTDVNANDHCPVCVSCVVAPTCRVTGGGVLLDDFVDQSCISVDTIISPLVVNGRTVEKITHGGQLGAPFSQMDCGTILCNPCIRGQWEHQRHYQGTGNPRDTIDMNFHTVTPKGCFDTLSCACLGCCTVGVDGHNDHFTVAKKFVVCNPDDHKVCGPQPRPAPANAIIFTGIGRLTPETDSGANNKAAEWVVFRVYIEDRSEPGGGHPGGAVEPADIYCFQAWKTGIKVSKKPDFSTVSAAFRQALGADSCAFINSISTPTQIVNGEVVAGVPPGTLPSPTVNGVTADINDCGPLHDGNHQIHPSTGATCNQ
jgi:hypothetical protein